MFLKKDTDVLRYELFNFFAVSKVRGLLSYWHGKYKARAKFRQNENRLLSQFLILMLK